MKNYMSERLNHIEPSKIVELTTKIVRLREEGQHIIGLNIGEPDFATPEHISDDRMETWLHRSGKRYCKSSKCNAEPDGFIRSFAVAESGNCSTPRKRTLRLFLEVHS
ncbi:hypothetical protein [Dorea sp.]|mgnify:CR=1 FL=1